MADQHVNMSSSLFMVTGVTSDPKGSSSEWIEFDDQDHSAALRIDNRYFGLGPLISMAGDAAKRTPLTSIGAVSSLDAEPDPNDPGIGGGFDHVSYFRNRFIPELAACTDEIETIFRQWAQDRKLTLPLREKQEGDLLIHAVQDGLKGFFELTYRVDQSRERARVTVFFVSNDGRRHTPHGIKGMLEIWEIDILQDDLDGALACGRA